MKRFLQFFQYNNAVPIVFAVVILGAGSTFAATNPEAFIVGQEKVVSSDTTYITSVDVANFDFQLNITDVTKDDSQYHVAYAYRSIGPVEYVWKEYGVENVFTVSYKELEGKDLGLFVAKQLGELMNHERKYLQEVQDTERARGASEKVVVTEYSGLIGKFLDTKEEVFPGYAPLIAEELATPVPSEQVAAVLEAVAPVEQGESTVSVGAVAAHIPTQEELDALIELKVNEILAQKSLQITITEMAPVNTPAPVSESPDPTPVQESPVPEETPIVNPTVEAPQQAEKALVSETVPMTDPAPAPTE